MATLASLPLKRGWRGLALGVVALVLISMVGPLFFLLGLHTTFHPAGRWAGIHESDPGPRLQSYDSVEAAKDFFMSEGDQSKHVEKLLTTLDPELKQDVIESAINDEEKKAISSSPVVVTREMTRSNNDSGGRLTPSMVEIKQIPDAHKDSGGVTQSVGHVNGMTIEETRKSCQLEFGSYCNWRKEHKEEMKDQRVKTLKDLLFLARAYYPIIAKLPSKEKLSHEMKQIIQDFEHIFSEASVDADLPFEIENKHIKMEEVIAKAKSFQLDCNYIDKKLRQILDLTEDEAHFHMKQSAFLYELAVQTKPKSHHCLSMRLTVEFFRSNLLDNNILQDDKSWDPSFFHYVIFSSNILASSVVINSSVMHAKESEKQVFHIITDGQNFAAMKLWFFRSSYGNASIHVLNIENFSTSYFDSSDSHQLYFSDEFRVSVRNTDEPLSFERKTEYISVFGSAYFVLPEIFPNLERVVVLDDDVVVQKDLSPLWGLQMSGKVNGAMEYCGLRLGQLKSYLGSNTYDSNSCAWMSGLNVIDLKKWRELNITVTFGNLLQSLRRENEALSMVATLPANLLTFQNQIYALDSSWALSGLGHDYSIDMHAIKRAAVLHYNGKMKPWLDLGISKYKRSWKKFLKRDDPYMEECNVST